MEKRKIVVCGATGNQGSAVVRQLLRQSKWEVYALSRNPSSMAARQLSQIGAIVIQADTRNFLTLKDAFEGAYGVYGVTQPWSADYKKCDIQDELLQGRNIIDAAKAACVEHLILSSIINFDNKLTGVPHVDSKFKLEHDLEAAELPHTILRLSQFMDNIGSKFFPVKEGKVKGFTAAHANVPYVACSDIGKFAAQVFASPKKFMGQKVNLIGDCVTGNNIAEILSQLRNPEAFRYSAVPSFILRIFAKEFYSMRRMFEKMGTEQNGRRLTDEATLSRNLMDNPLTVREHLNSVGYSYKVLSK